MNEVMINCVNLNTTIKISLKQVIHLYISVRTVFSSWSECCQNNLGTVVILPLIRIGYLYLTFSGLKHVILD